jgi:hypothetical protein
MPNSAPLPVILKAPGVVCRRRLQTTPGAESRMNKLFGHAETAIQRLFSFAGTPREWGVTDGDEIRNRSIPFNLYRKRVLHGRWSSIMLARAFPCYAGTTSPCPSLLV